MEAKTAQARMLLWGSPPGTPRISFSTPVYARFPIPVAATISARKMNIGTANMVKEAEMPHVCRPMR